MCEVGDDGLSDVLKAKARRGQIGRMYHDGAEMACRYSIIATVSYEAWQHPAPQMGGGDRN